MTDEEWQEIKDKATKHQKQFMDAWKQVEDSWDTLHNNIGWIFISSSSISIALIGNMENEIEEKKP